MQPQATPRTLIIINQVAARATRAWTSIKDTLAQEEIKFDLHLTTERGDAETQTRRALLAGYDTIAVVGGDGTLSEAASGFFDLENEFVSALPRNINPTAALALLPAGTGDDFARGLTERRAPLAEWLQKFVRYCRGKDEPTTRAVDCLYGTVESGAHKFICLNAATLGLGAGVAMRVANQGKMLRRLSGETRFALAALGAIARWREQFVRVRVDHDEPVECRSNLLAVANGLYAGGGMMLSPHARPDDNLLDVIIACDLSRPELLRELARVHRGGHLANPKIRALRGSRVSIETLNAIDKLPLEADGNLRGYTPAEFRVIPNALRVVC